MKLKGYWLCGIACTLIFCTLYAYRFGLFENRKTETRSVPIPAETIPMRDRWMNIFQGETKIGYSRSQFRKTGSGYTVKESALMKINTMGMAQEIRVSTEAQLNPDLSLNEFSFQMHSGRFEFRARGKMNGLRMTLETGTGQDMKTSEIRLKKPPLLAAGLYDALAAAELPPGAETSFYIFDPATMGQRPVKIRSLGNEQVQTPEGKIMARAVEVDFKGMKQKAWLDADGQVLREEGMLGIRLEKTTRSGALDEIPLEPGQDLTFTASVPVSVTFPEPDALQKLVLEIDGIQFEGLSLAGGRQKLKGHHLTIEKESIGNGSEIPVKAAPGIERYLQSSPFVQADHPDIAALSRKLTAGIRSPLEKVRVLQDWVHRNIEKKPVFSVPDAVSTLKARTGDCNEHAVLMAALARAAGIPAQIEAGLVYLKGRFYYHAWNRFYLGKWITADALFGQLPADVTHIRLSEGEMEEQLDLIGVIGKIQLKVIGYTP